MRRVLPAFSSLESSDFTSAAAFSVRRTTGPFAISASISECNLVARCFSVKLVRRNFPLRDILERFAPLLVEGGSELGKFLRHALANFRNFDPLLHFRC